MFLENTDHLTIFYHILNLRWRFLLLKEELPDMSLNREERFVPWFGAWPPKFKGEVNNLEEETSKKVGLISGFIVVGLLFWITRQLTINISTIETSKLL